MRRVRLDHLVDEQLLVIDVGRDLAAPALLDRLGDINRQRFVPIIAQVLDEFDVPGERVRLDTLHVALGSFAPDAFRHADARLRDRLRAALRAALAGGTEGTALREREGRALVTAFEHYLLHGAWPIASAIALDAAPADLLAQLISEDPLALVAMLRRRGTSDTLLRRLVRQIPERLLAALLHRLEPVHAAYVLAYLDEVRERHAAERLVAASPAQLAEMLWTIVLRDALEETGLQANRKAFLLRLLKQLARSGGTTLAALIAQLRRGLPRTLARRRAPGSLVAVLGELIAEEPGLLAGAFGISELAALLDRPGLSERERREAARLTACADPQQLRWLLRRLAGEAPERLASTIEEVLPFDHALAAIWNIEARGLPVAIATLVRSRAERVALLALAAQSAEQGAIAGRMAASLIARMRGVPVDRITLAQAKPVSVRGAAPSGALARLAAALAEAGERPSPSDLTRIRQMLAGAMAVDPLAARQLLRGFAAADPQQLCVLLGKPDAPEGVAGELLAPHLAACLAAFARAARCATREWQALLAVAAGTDDSDLPEALLATALAGVAQSRRVTEATLRAWLAGQLIGLDAGDRTALASLWSPPARNAARHTALEQFAFLWSGRDGLSSGERAELLARLLPSLSGLAPGMLRARLAGSASSGARMLHRLRSLPTPALVRLALLLSAAKPVLRNLSPEAMPRAVMVLLEGASLDTQDERATGIDAAMRARLPPRELLDTLTVHAPETTPTAAWVERRPAGTADRGADARALVALLAQDEPHPSARLRQIRRSMKDLRLAALLRARPFAALRIVAETGDAPPALVSLVADAQATPQLFAAMPHAERARAEATMRLLTGRKGRSAIPPAKLARALALAATARDWRGDFGRGFTAEWLRHLFTLASLAEQAALHRLLEALPEDARIAAPRKQKPSEKPLPKAIAAKASALLMLQPDAPLGAIRRALEDPRRRARLARELAEAELVELLLLLAPTTAAGLLHVAERLAAARRAGGAPLDRAVQWDCILAASRAPHPVPRLVGLFLDGADGVPPPPASTRARVEAVLSASLEGMRDAPLRIALDLRERDRKRRAAEARSATPDTAPCAIHIANAGLVLVSAFLPRLFQSLDHVVPDGEGWRWRDRECQARAVHLLQWLVDARSDAPEPQLALNKLLCGMAVAEPVPTGVTLDDRELRMGGTLLATILASWPPLADSGTDALRQTFFQREGRLTRGEQGWSLEVETRVLDILLDQLPWGFSTILHPWMPAPLAVQWR